MGVRGAKSVTFAVFLGMAAAGATVGYARMTSGTANVLTIQPATGTQRRWIDERDLALHTDILRIGLGDHRRVGLANAFLPQLARFFSRLSNGTFVVFRSGEGAQLSRRYYGKPNRVSWGDAWQPVVQDRTPALDWAVALTISAATGSLTPWPLLGALLGALIGSGLWAEWQTRPRTRPLLQARMRHLKQRVSTEQFGLRA